MSTMIDKAITLDVPVETAYAQWTQFEDFPLFMDGVERLEQLEDDRLRWKVQRRGVERVFDAAITEQHPNLRIAWTVTGDQDGPEHDGVVTFHYLSETRCRVMLQLHFEPQGFFEQYAEKTGLVERWVTGNLENFKEFLEKRGKPTGAWLGRIPHAKVQQTAWDEPADHTEGTNQAIDKRNQPDGVASADKHEAVDHKTTVS